MLSTNKRVNKTIFKQISNKGKMVRGKFFSILVVFDENHKTSKFSVVVSKKVDKRAVVRNKIKRKVQAFLERKHHTFNSAFIIVIFPQKTVIDQTNKQLEEELSLVFKKIGVLKS